MNRLNLNHIRDEEAGFEEIDSNNVTTNSYMGINTSSRIREDSISAFDTDRRFI